MVFYFNGSNNVSLPKTQLLLNYIIDKLPIITIQKIALKKKSEKLGKTDKVDLTQDFSMLIKLKELF